MGMGMGGAPMEKGGMCPCPHHRMVPIGKGVAILLFGGAFLLANLGLIGRETRDILWPLAIVLVGFGKLGSASCPCCGKMGHQM